MQVNVGTSGAEIGAAFGGNKVRTPFNSVRIISCVVFPEHWLGQRVWRGRMEAICSLECCYL